MTPPLDVCDVKPRGSSASTLTTVVTANCFSHLVMLWLLGWVLVGVNQTVDSLVNLHDVTRENTERSFQLRGVTLTRPKQMMRIHKYPKL